MTLTTTRPTYEQMQAELVEAGHLVETLQESLEDAKLALEDRGWDRIGSLSGLDEFDKDYLTRAAKMCRASAVINPLVGRAINLRIAYVWGSGVEISARQGEDAPQDVAAVVQGFLDDPLNRAAFTSAQAREENERALATDGNVVLILVTSPLTGRVQVRSVPFSEVTDLIRNPDDRDDVWFVRRTATTTTLTPSATGAVTAAATTTVFHPTVTYRPRRRPKTIDGHEVAWDQPAVHVSVNRLDGWKWGIGDVYAAVSWARGYSEFLQDWAKLMRSLAKIAWTATAKNKPGAQQVRARLGAADEAGGAAVLAEGQQLQAVSKSGATIDADSGRPLAAMVASAVDLPVTLLLSDPGVTGARAVAETLDRPTHLLMQMRRELWGDVHRAVLGHVIDAAVRAPQGPLRGTITTDPVTGLDRIELLGGQDRTIEITWPDLDETDPKVLVEAVTAADGTGKMPPLLVAQLLMQALRVEDVDEWLNQLTDADGEFIDQADAAAARSVLAAVARGDMPDQAA